MSGFSGDYYELVLEGITLNGLPMPPRTIHLPRVTKILDALPKYLQWWGYRMGLLEGRRLASGGLTATELSMDDHSFYEHVKKLGREGEATTPSNSLEDAGSRGLVIHDIAEDFFRHRRVPDPDSIPKELHGYVKALASWWTDMPDWTVDSTESTLYSLRHGYAGTTDLILHTGPCEFTVIDFKTSKSVYDSALIQLAAYVEAAQEMELVPSTGCLVKGAVVRLGASGKYQMKYTPCTIEDFLVVKNQWELLERLKGGENGWTTSLDIVRDGGGPGNAPAARQALPAEEGKSLVTAD